MQQAVSMRPFFPEPALSGWMKPPLVAGDLTIDALTRPRVEYIRPWFRAGRAAEYLRARGLDGAPVVDDDGRPIGYLSLSDIRDAIARTHDADSLLVRDVRLADILVIREVETVAEVLVKMSMPTPPMVCLVDEDGVLTGAVWVIDLIRWLAQVTPPEMWRQG